MTDHRNDRQRNAAWDAAQQWRERARHARPQGNVGGFRLLATWLLFGVLMVVGTVLGLFFLLVGWAMLPFLRHRMKKRMERMRAEQAEDIGGFDRYHDRRGRHQDVLEGQYEVKDDDRNR
ncbi:hypothetical protein GCM10007160_37080 [Litchfieldella qijiaojingensis]|uniref:DUF3742 family protein n=1 Tax=Litchfieldella qijiaojingensis TaxID=980347 RepID=A0ABQ2Z8M7_9GAMM|nr:hypothetical protein [Halomonas qijiaojingensis]GGY06078.1 hypothetical protein GCM10007160_37080 [Halomonas qijiaojingensis]